MPPVSAPLGTTTHVYNKSENFKESHDVDLDMMMNLAIESHLTGLVICIEGSQGTV